MSKKFDTILCPVDFTPLSERAFELAVSVCQKTGARLVLHHNLGTRPPNFLTVSWMWSEDHEAAEEDKAAEAPEHLQELFARIPEGVEDEAKITRAPTETALIYLANELPADLIIMGTHGRSDAKHQSLTEKVIVQAPCSVMTLGEGYDPEAIFARLSGEPPEELTVLLPFDFGPRSRSALNFGLALARAMPHRIHLLHVVDTSLKDDEPAPSSDHLDQLRVQLADLVPADMADRVTTEVKLGHAVERITETAAEQDALFVVMAANAKGLIKRFLFGTTTLGVLHKSAFPVWFLPPAMVKAHRSPERT